MESAKAAVDAEELLAFSCLNFSRQRQVVEEFAEGFNDFFLLVVLAGKAVVDFLVEAVTGELLSGFVVTSE